MARFEKLITFRGDEIYVNVDLVTAVTKGTAVGIKGTHSTVHFSNEHGFMVKGSPSDVIEVLWPVSEQKKGD